MIQASTKDVRLFSAVTSMGIPWTEESGAVAGGERVWLFGDVSDCGKWKLADLLKWWRDRNFHSKNPSHPFNVVKCCMGSDRGIRTAIAKGCGHNQRQAGDSYVIESSGEGYKPAQINGRATDCIGFAAALSSVGFKVQPAPLAGNIFTFAIGQKSETRGYTYAEASAWWVTKGFEERNGQHPFAYAKSVAINYGSAVKALHQDRPLVKWRPKGSIGTGLIHPDCSSETEAKMNEWLKGK